MTYLLMDLRHPPPGGCGLKCAWTTCRTHGQTRHPPPGGCGLKWYVTSVVPLPLVSPSARRVWIEICFRGAIKCKPMSPSARRVWIEITHIRGSVHSSRRHPPPGGCGLKYVTCEKEYEYRRSPSARRVWIEISRLYVPNDRYSVTLRPEGVD